jgi:SAM-dependent methyltransferase
LAASLDDQGLRRAETRGCRACAAALDGPSLDLGALPVCNRFSAERRDLPRQPLVLVGCATCGLIQLREPPAIALVTPEAAWIRYTEPQAHLDDLVESLLALRKSEGGLALGLGPFEAPLLERLARRGMRTEAPDLAAVEAGASPAGGDYPYLETWQARLEAGRLGRLAQGVGAAAILSCRYLLEHCHDPIASLQALRRLVDPDGLLVLEIPDSAKFLAAADYSFPWEEHVCYFVEASFRDMVERAGYDVVALKRYPGLLEDALVILARPSDAAAPRAASRSGGPDPSFAAYRAAYPATRAFAQSRLADLAGPARDRVALFGLGHQAVMFVNALGLADFIGAAVDDDPHKRGLLPPGFATRVTSSADLFENPAVATCLLAVNPASEPKVRAKLAPLAARGVALHSIYAAAEGSILTGRPL